MVHTARITIAPTLDRMAHIYSLSRSGGRNSPRFVAYLGDVEHNWGLSAFNPMAGDSAAATVDALLALGAERLAAEAAHAILERCEWTEAVTLAVVVATPGMWTDRLATEVRHRTFAERRQLHGEVLLWATDAQDAATIETESAAEAVRTLWAALHGPVQSLHDVLAREGLAYALTREARVHEPIGIHHIREALDILGDTSVLSDIVAVLYGDDVATALGYTPLGIADRAGYAFAIARAAQLIDRVGGAEALRAGPSAMP